MSKNVFVHIPKTAGTSFREAAKEYFQDKCFFDYEYSHPETSEIFKKYYYENRDLYNIRSFFKKLDNFFVSGHFAADKYISIFNVKDYVTFVRNPIKQVISHYNHYVIHKDYQENLMTFVKDERFRNVQYKMLKSLDLEVYGFVGITESYKDSLYMFNMVYNCNLKFKNSNINKNKYKDYGSLTSEEIEIIKEYNKFDLSIYNKAINIFNRRKEIINKGKMYTNIYIFNQNPIQGIAYRHNTEKAIHIELYENDKKIDEQCANKLTNYACQANFPRDSFIEFNFDYNYENNWKKKVFLKIKDTDEIIYIGR